MLTYLSQPQWQNKPQRQSQWRVLGQVRRHVDIHLVMDDRRVPFRFFEQASADRQARLYPTNTMRNVAMQGARSEWVVTIEGDMTLDAHARKRLLQHAKRFQNSEAYQGKVAFILPLFEEVAGSGEHVVEQPATKKRLVHAVEDGRLVPYAAPSHDYFNMSQWTEANDPYLVTLPGRMEPYYMVRRALNVQYDQHVLCYRDKVHQLELMARAQFRFVILPDVFVLDHSHQPVPLDTINRTYSSAVSADFRQGDDKSRVTILPPSDSNSSSGYIYAVNSIEHNNTNYNVSNFCDHPWINVRNGPFGWASWSQGIIAHHIILTESVGGVTGKVLGPACSGAPKYTYDLTSEGVLMQGVLFNALVLFLCCLLFCFRRYQKWFRIFQTSGPVRDRYNTHRCTDNWSLWPGSSMY